MREYDPDRLQEFDSRMSAPSPEGCQMWQGQRNTRGYPAVNQKLGGQATAARTIYQALWGEAPKGLRVLMSCGKRDCVAPAHMTIGDSRMAYALARRAGRGNIPKRFGEKNKNAKLDRIQVEQIRKLYRAGDTTMFRLANIFGVSMSTVSFIVRGKSWPQDRGDDATR